MLHKLDSPHKLHTGHLVLPQGLPENVIVVVLGVERKVVAANRTDRHNRFEEHDFVQNFHQRQRSSVAVAC